ncbi:MAG: hypothetical protein ACI4KO_06330 [Ruminiclostridium sp.]
MTEFKLNWSEEAVNEYIDLMIKGKNLQVIPVILFAVCIVTLIATGIIMFAFTGNIISLIVSACGVLFGGAVAVTVIFLKKSLYKKISEAYKELSDLVAAISDKDITLIRNNIPYGIISWDKIGDITYGKKAFYLTTKENALLILEKNAVVSGVLSEAEEILKIKEAAIGKSE